MTTIRRLLLVGLTSACVLLPLVGTASALGQEAPPEIGWWTANQVAGVPIGQALLVPPGGSQVAAGADGAISVAAVRFPAGAGGGTYRVGVELGSDTEGVTVIACPTTGSWAAVHGAPLSDAPAWDCTLAQATGTIDADAGTVAWDLTGDFVRDGTVDAMLLPPEAADSSTLTMSAPGADAVTPLAEPAPAASPPPSSPPTTAAAPRTGASGDGPSVASPSVATSPGPLVSPAPGPTAPVGLPSPLPTAPTASTPDDEVAAAPSLGDVSSTSGRVLGGLVLAALLVGAVLVSRLSPTPAAVGADGRGVGRFVRPRSEPPLSI